MSEEITMLDVEKAMASMVTEFIESLVVETQMRKEDKYLYYKELISYIPIATKEAYKQYPDEFSEILTMNVDSFGNGQRKVNKEDIEAVLIRIYYAFITSFLDSRKGMDVFLMWMVWNKNANNMDGDYLCYFSNFYYRFCPDVVKKIALAHINK